MRQEGSDERTDRHDVELPAPGKFQPGARQLLGVPVTPLRRRDLDVSEANAVARELIVQVGGLALGDQLEPRARFVMNHLRFVGHGPFLRCSWTARQQYQAATARYGRNRSPSFWSRLGVGIFRKP